MSTRSAHSSWTDSLLIFRFVSFGILFLIFISSNIQKDGTVIYQFTTNLVGCYFSIRRLLYSWKSTNSSNHPSVYTMWIQTRHPAWPIHVLPTTRTLPAKLGTPQVDMAENVAALKFLCSQLTTSKNSWYPLVNVYMVEDGPVEIVDNYPFNSMVDLSIVFCKRLPEANWFPITYVSSLGFHCSLAGTCSECMFWMERMNRKAGPWRNSLGITPWLSLLLILRHLVLSLACWVYKTSTQIGILLPRTGRSSQKLSNTCFVFVNTATPCSIMAKFTHLI